MKNAGHLSIALKYNDGCTYNGIILTQQIGERVEADMHTFACFIDLKKAFDAVQRRLLRGRLRSFAATPLGVVLFIFP